MNKKEVSRARAKLDIGSLQSIVLIIALVALIASFTLQILGDVRDDMTVNSAERNATDDGIEAVAKIPEKLPIIVTVIVAAIIIGTLVTYFATRKR